MFPTLPIMWIQGYLHKLMALLPLAFLVALGINGRIPRQGPEIGQYGPLANSQLLAFSGPIELVSRLRAGSDSQEVFEVARLWAAGYEEGRLMDVPYAQPMDGSRDIAQSDISESRAQLLAHLLEVSRQAQLHGDFDVEAEAISLSYVVARVAKYNGIDDLRTLSKRQTRLADRLSDIAPRLSRLVATRSARRLETAERAVPGLASVVVSARGRELLWCQMTSGVGDTVALAAGYQGLVAGLSDPATVGYDGKLDMEDQETEVGFNLMAASAFSARKAEEIKVSAYRHAIDALLAQSPSTNRPSDLRSSVQPASFAD